MSESKTTASLAPQVHWKPGVINAIVLATFVGVLFSFNYVVDPFDLNRSVDLGLAKKGVAHDLSNYAWKYPEFIHEPAAVIIVGDSRARRLPAEVFEEALGKPTYNFAFAGATAWDATATFWFADEHAKLKTVYFGLGALLLNDSIRVQRGQRDRELLRRPLRYYFSPFVTSASAKVLLFNAVGAKLSGEKPPMDREAFWDHQLRVPPRQYYGNYAYPNDLMAELGRIVDHCDREGIEIVFFMPPTHVDLQAKRVEFGIEADYQRSLRQLRALATVFDWDYDNELTREASLFGDPFHPTDEVAAKVAHELATGEPWLAKH